MSPGEVQETPGVSGGRGGVVVVHTPQAEAGLAQVEAGCTPEGTVPER